MCGSLDYFVWLSQKWPLSRRVVAGILGRYKNRHRRSLVRRSAVLVAVLLVAAACSPSSSPTSTSVPTSATAVVDTTSAHPVSNSIEVGPDTDTSIVLDDGATLEIGPGTVDRPTTMRFERLAGAPAEFGDIPTIAKAISCPG